MNCELQRGAACRNPAHKLRACKMSRSILDFIGLSCKDHSSHHVKRKDKNGPGGKVILVYVKLQLTLGTPLFIIENVSKEVFYIVQDLVGHKLVPSPVSVTAFMNTFAITITIVFTFDANHHAIYRHA